MTNKKDNKSGKGAGGLPSNHAIFAPAYPRRFDHALFFDPAKHRLDEPTRIARTLAAIIQKLLEHFPDPAPIGSYILAKRAEFKALRLTIFENTILKGGSEPAPSTDQAYLSLSGSLRGDIESLFRMAKEGAPIEREPSLGEYLEAINSGKLVVGEPGKAEEGEG